MNTQDIKKIIYHHWVTAKLYNIIRNYRRDKDNKLSDEEFAKKYFYKNTGRTLNIEKPETFDEKLWYLKLHERNPLLTICTDKFRVREYVKECGLTNILNTLYGVYDSFEEIPFNELPESFFIKCNHTSGTNIIYDRKQKFDYRFYKNEFDFWMKRNYYWGSREWNYKDITPKIICEKVLRDKNGRLPMDYKLMCFGGKVKLLFLDIGVATNQGEHAEQYYRNIYDRDFKLMPIKETRENYLDKPISKPDNWDIMVQYAERLAQPFKTCRVDLYNIDGRIYFGEITFYHGGGCNDIQPEEWARTMGSWISIE
ncbi:MAG: glycosyl transferase [Clostridium sp.]|nr:glycosyl transferase [Clostridium sp.]MDD6179911.1 ATP-grasp fold amidoligase family protein [Clostridium sp.]